MIHERATVARQLIIAELEAVNPGLFDIKNNVTCAL